MIREGKLHIDTLSIFDERFSYLYESNKISFSGLYVDHLELYKLFNHELYSLLYWNK